MTRSPLSVVRCNADLALAPSMELNVDRPTGYRWACRLSYLSYSDYVTTKPFFVHLS